jgi:hypothetical protein
MPNRAGSAPRHSLSLAERQRAAAEKALRNAVKKIRELKAAASATRTAKGGARKRATRRRRH